MQVLGLKPKYAIGDALELTCVSDLTRPRAQLAWILNGVRVTRNNAFGAELSETVELSPQQAPDKQPSSDTSEPLEGQASDGQSRGPPQLSRASLAIRLRVTRALLSAFNATAAKAPKSAQSATSSNLSGGRQGVKLASVLQCRMRLVEVSDISVDELALSNQLLSDEAANEDDESGPSNALAGSESPLAR